MMSPPSVSRVSGFVEELADPNLLREAWYRVQHAGRTPGVDRMTVDAFRATADRRLQELGAALREGRYRPSPLLRISIPKASGGWRALGIPTIIDRVAQSAAAMVLHERIGALYSPRSFAYRPFLGPRRAAIFLKHAISRFTWAVTADIEKYFDTVDHQILHEQLRAAGIDPLGIYLLRQWLIAPVHDKGQRLQPVKGLPQGAPIAPVLANLYLSGFDTTLEAEGFTHVRYADDFIVFAEDQASAVHVFNYVTRFLEGRLRLRIKSAKTQMASTDAGLTFVGYRFTRTAWTLPEDAAGRFRSEIERLLQPSGSAHLPATLEAHNNLVRGWRHYYGGNSPEMDAELDAIDQWRRDACRAYLTAHDIQPSLAESWFERLRPVLVGGHPGAYDSWTTTHEPPIEHEGDEDADLWHAPREAGRAATRQASTTNQIRTAEIGRRQAPVVLDDRWLRIPTHGAFVSRSKDVLIVRRKRQTIFECAFDDVSAMTIEGRGVVVSTTVIEGCIEHDISLTLARSSGKAVGRLVAARNAARARDVRAQLAVAANRAGTIIIATILTAKLANQRALLLYHAKYRGRPDAVRTRLQSAAASIRGLEADLRRFAGQPIRRARRDLFLLEARAAAHYWSAFAALVPVTLAFDRRRHRAARDWLNQALNYGYAILGNRVWTAIVRAGLEPALGILHTGRRRSDALVFDLIEPYRQPVVDRAVLSLVGRGWRPEANGAGELSVRTRATLHRALSRRLQGGDPSIGTHLNHCATTLRRTMTDGAPYKPYRMSW